MRDAAEPDAVHAMRCALNAVAAYAARGDAVDPDAVTVMRWPLNAVREDAVAAHAVTVMRLRSMRS